MDYMTLRRTWRYRVRMSLRGCHLRPKFGLHMFEEEFCLDLFGFLIALPFLDRWVYHPHELMESWGFSIHARDVHLNWGSHCKILHFPWEYVFIKHEVQRPDDSWVPYVGCWETGPGIPNTDGVVVIKGGKEPDGRWEATFPYHYLLLPSGEVQHSQATVYVERREWRQKWLKWCPWFAKVRKSISISFDCEMGNEAGSWKGGVIGTGYEMRPGETAEDTLRRMQREHRFDR